MKKIVIFFAIFFTLCYATNVTGSVSGTWDIDGSPYYITENVTVPVGDTLKINPGVQVKAHQSTRLTVVGTLLAIGHPDSLITFGSNTYGRTGTFSVISNVILVSISSVGTLNSSTSPSPPGCAGAEQAISLLLSIDHDSETSGVLHFTNPSGVRDATPLVSRATLWSQSSASVEHDARYLPSRLKATAVTLCVCGLMTCCKCQQSRSCCRTRTTPSWNPTMTVVQVGSTTGEAQCKHEHGCGNACE